ncbi:CHAT domain-containing protein [Ramlibacter sp.]|uniref:CHAT domain-containing protein n=1 Tax=Ramlibacter sp. TaxID=1917967 RepID=UPI003D0C0AB3
MVHPQLELYVLHGSATARLLVLACRGPDIAVHEVERDSDEIRAFVAFRQEIERVALGAARPTVAELDALGDRMFRFFFGGAVRELYDKLPPGRFSVQVAADAPDLHGIPWEYLRPPNRVPVPHPERCVVRVLPIRASTEPKPATPRERLRVLLAVADPVDEPGVGWSDVHASLRRAFEAQTSFAAELKIVPGASARDLLRALGARRYDVFHFLGHGGVSADGEGELALVDVDRRTSDRIRATDLALALGGQGLKLCILSACLSSAGDARDDFGPVATALLRAGIPAVVANQASIPVRSVAPFLGALYTRLLSDGNIDSAMSAARVALAIDLRNTVEPGRAIVEWGIPTLYRLPGAAQVFRVGRRA